VLKDAAATSIYGARGSNGVILITTKKGSVGATKVNLTLDSGISEPTNRLEFVNAREYLALAKEAWYYAGNDPATFWDNSGVLVDGLTKEEALQTDTNWQDQALGTGLSTNLNLSVSGGDSKTRFFISGGMLNENSIFEGNEYLRLTTRTNIEHTISSKLKIGTTLTYTDIDNKPIPVQEGLGKATNALPIWPVKKADGTYFRPIDNVRASIDLWDIQIRSKQLIGSWFLNYKIADGLVFTSNYGLNSLNTTNRQYRDALLNFDGLATALVDISDRKSWNFKNLLNFKKQLGKHNIDFLVGTEAQKTTQNSNVISGKGFINSTVNTPQDAAQVNSNYFESTYTFMSYLSRLNYDYKGKYLLSLTARRDGSSRFGRNNQWGFFPAVSLGYILSEESFFKTLRSTINFLKIRASYGISGNAEIGNYLFASTYSQSNYNSNNGITLANIGDDKLGWEATEQRNLGISLELFDGRFRLEADYYEKLTTDLLLPYPVSVVSGLTEVTTNLGEISNTGYEFLLGVTISDRENFDWESEVTFSRNKNVVLDIGDNVEGLNLPGFGTTSIYVGKPIGIQTLPIWNGIDPATGLDIYLDKEGNSLRQDQAIAEYGSLNSFLNANLQPYGNPFPDFVGSITNRINWKDVYINALFTFEYGADYIAAGEAINTKYAFSSFTSTPLRYALNRWRNPGEITNIGRLTTDPTIYTRTSEFISDVDFIRMKDLTIGYILRLKDSKTFESLNIYSKFTNYLTFTNAKPWIYDPENYRNGGNLNLLERWKSSPQAKTITLGLNINF
jgi:TonB-linked SusC/RagA family outer membrane protein